MVFPRVVWIITRPFFSSSVVGSDHPSISSTAGHLTCLTSQSSDVCMRRGEELPMPTPGSRAGRL